MRPKIYLPVLGLVLLAALLLMLGRSRPQPTPVVTEKAPAPASVTETIPAPAAEPVVLTPSPTLTVVLPAENPGLTANDLMALTMNDDAESLKKILAALASAVFLAVRLANGDSASEAVLALRILINQILPYLPFITGIPAVMVVGAILFRRKRQPES